MKIRIIRWYFKDVYRCKVTINNGSMDANVYCNFKNYRGVISSDYKKVNLIDPLPIEGMNGEKPKLLMHLTINKYDIKCVERYINDTY